jgi:hypothetical protein
MKHKEVQIAMTVDEVMMLFTRAIEDGDLDRAELWATGMLIQNDPASDTRST